MRAFTRYETAVVASLGVAGLGVALTAALADNLNIPARKFERFVNAS